MQIQQHVNKKWVEKSVKCIMVGYSHNHSPDMYHMYDPQTGMIMADLQHLLGQLEMHQPSQHPAHFPQHQNYQTYFPIGATDDDELELIVINCPNATTPITSISVDEEGRIVTPTPTAATDNNANDKVV